MILEADLGNSRIKWRLRDAEQLLASSVTEDLASFLLQSNKQVLAQNLPLARFCCVSVRSQSANEELAGECEALWGVSPEFARAEALLAGVVNGYESPLDLGADRWLAVVAAYSRLAKSCVVVDAGSAITVDLVSDQGRHLGGYIAPGLQLMRRSLGMTAGVRVSAESGIWDSAPGRSTQAAVTAALSAMVSGLIDEGIHQLEVKGAPAPELVLTGGDASWLKTRYPAAHYWPDLVLDGLAIAMPGS